MRFLSPEQVIAIREKFGTPVYVYDEQTLAAAARSLLDFPNAYGLTARFAMKALPTGAVLRLFNDLGLHIDASSGHEVTRALRAGFPPDHIQITAQQIPADLKQRVDQGVLYNACSIQQIRVFGELFPGAELSIRVNPGLGSGHSNRTNVGGPASSFGIWHEHLDAAQEAADAHGLRITGLHSHIGSGGDPAVWSQCAKLSLAIAARFPKVGRLNLGGGFKVARMPEETAADLQEIGASVQVDFENFFNDHGRKLHLELEPGTFLVANAGALVVSIIDKVDTGAQGFSFLKTDSGMTEILRPSMYGAQHPMTVVPAEERPGDATSPFVVVGHCCESGDILTPEPGDPEGLAPRQFATAEIGDALVIGDTGAYCAAQSAKNYNSFPEAPEVLLAESGTLQLIRKRQHPDQITANEIL